jgi:hypothetical protein
VGYDDWRPGTFSLQLNQWGPIATGSLGRLFDGAVLDAGYKVPLPSPVSRFLNLSPHLAYALGRTPSASLILGAQPYRSFFLSVGVRFGPLDASPWSWTYTFGYAGSWPVPWRLAYSNWGPNSLFAPNFVANGAITLSASFQLLPRPRPGK